MATIRREKRTEKWEAIIRRKGHKTVSGTFDSYEEAEGWATLEEARVVGRRAAFAALQLTLGQLLDRYEKEISAHKSRPDLERSIIRMWKDSPLADRALGDLEAGDYQSWIDEQAKRVGYNRLRLYRALVSHLYTICRRRWKIPGLGNPAADVEIPRDNARAYVGRPAPDERLLDKVLAACNERLRTFMLILCETGMRRGELATLTWDRVKFQRRIVMLEKTKNGRPRAVALSPTALSLFQGLRPQGVEKPSGSVWSIKDPHSWSKLWRDACKRAGVPSSEVWLHDARRLRTSELYARGWQIPEVMSAVGHRTWQMSREYTDLEAERLAERLAREEGEDGDDKGETADNNA